MISDSRTIIKRQEQITLWEHSETNKAPSNIKEAEKVKFPKEVQFLCACNSNDWPEIKRLLSEGININCTQDDGLTALHQACIDDDYELVKFLVEQGANLDAKDKDGWTPLFAAVSCGYLEITKYLIASGARLDLVSYDGELPINQSPKDEITEYLRKEMEVRDLNEFLIKNLERSTMLNDVEEMRKTGNFENFFLVDNGATMLHVAASKDYTDVMEKLLSFLPPELLNKTDNDGWNALHVAAHWGNRRASIMLVDADIEFDQSTKANQTPMDVADDEVRPYLREEIRKARFRRQDKPVKRPAETPNGEYSPSSTKFLCPDKTKEQTDVQPSQPSTESSQLNGTTDNTQSQQRPASPPVIPTPVVDSTPTIQQSQETDTLPSETQSKDIHETLPMEVSPSPTKETKEISDQTIQNENKRESPPKSSNSQENSNKSEQAEVVRMHESKTKRRQKKPTQTILDEDLQKARSKMQEDEELEMALLKSKTNTTDSTEKNTTTNIVDSSSENMKENQEEFKSNTESSTDTKQPPTVEANLPQHSETTDKSINNTSQSETAQNDTDNSQKSSRLTGGHVVNKKRVRNRPPTQVVDLNDIEAAKAESEKYLNNTDNEHNNNNKVDVDNNNSGNTINNNNQSRRQDRHYHHVQNTKLTPNSSNEIKNNLDYKILYENECLEKEKLKRNLNRIKKELDRAQEEVKQLKNNPKTNSNNKNNTISDADYKEIERLREENKKMKEANNALIRVISRLSNKTNN